MLTVFLKIEVCNAEKGFLCADSEGDENFYRREGNFEVKKENA